MAIGLLFFKLDWKALCTGGYKPHRVAARARILELQDTRYKKLYLKSAFNFNISNISH